MDTGLEDGIPAFFVEMLEVAALDGRVLARLETFELLAANPLFTLEVNPGAVGEAGYALAGRDNNGNGISAAIGPANKGHVTLPPVTGRPLAAN